MHLNTRVISAKIVFYTTMTRRRLDVKSSNALERDCFCGVTVFNFDLNFRLVLYIYIFFFLYDFSQIDY